MASFIQLEEIFSQSFKERKPFTLKDDITIGKVPTLIQEKNFDLDAETLESIPYEEKFKPNFSMLLEKERCETSKKQAEFSHSDQRNQIKNMKLYPYSCIGLVTFKLGEKMFFGSGCLIGPKVVLTCAHNLYDDHEQIQYKEVKFIPAAEGTNGRTHIAKKVYFPEEYKNLSKEEKNQYDFGIIELAVDLEATNGYLGVDVREANIEQKEEVQICGYSRHKQHQDEKVLYSALGYCNDKRKDFFLYGMPTEKGQSGCPLITKTEDGQFTIGVHIGNWEDQKRNVALRLNKIKKELINKWIGYLSGEMDLSNRNLGNAGMSYLAQKWSKKIFSLNLQNNGITSEGMGLLSKGDWIHLEVLSLAFNPIRDEGIRFLKCFPNLKSLNLQNTQISNEGAWELSQIQFQHLSVLDLKNNGIEDEEVIESIKEKGITFYY